MKLRRYEIVNQVEYLTEEQIKKGCSNSAIRKWAYILHDKDIEVKPHYHVMIWLKSNYDSKYVAIWFGVQEQFLGRIHDDASAMEYLTHINAPVKHQYESNEIISNYDIAEGIEEAKAKKSKIKRLEEIILGIDEGTIREYNYHEHIAVYEYVRYKRDIESAFNYRKQRMKGINRVMDCIFITGLSGTGKTTYAKQIVDNCKMSVYISSGSNDVLDDYQGQDCIILDDLRPSCMGLSDLLKLLDNNTSSAVKSRYKNKILECKMIIITTTLKIEDFFNKVFADSPESAIQLMRRCETKIHMTPKVMRIYQWLKGSQEYKFLGEAPNLALQDYNVDDISIDEALDKVGSVLKLSSNIIDEMKKSRKIDEEELPVNWR